MCTIQRFDCTVSQGFNVTVGMVNNGLYIKQFTKVQTNKSNRIKDEKIITIYSKQSVAKEI